MRDINRIDKALWIIGIIISGMLIYGIVDIIGSTREYNKTLDELSEALAVLHEALHDMVETSKDTVEIHDKGKRAEDANNVTMAMSGGIDLDFVPIENSNDARAISITTISTEKSRTWIYDYENRLWH